MKKFMRALCVVVFMAGLLAFSKAQINNTQDNGQGQHSDLEPVQPFVMKAVQYFVSPDGTKKITGRRTRYVNANGDWRLVLGTPRPEGGPSKSAKEELANTSKELNVYAGGADGVFARETALEGKRAVSPSADQQMQQYFRSHKYYRNHIEFVRMDEVAGLPVYVLRTDIKDPDNPQDYIETSYSPKTGFTFLRTLIHYRDGSYFLIEAESIEFKDVPEDLNDDLKNLPVREKAEKHPNSGPSSQSNK